MRGHVSKHERQNSIIDLYTAHNELVEITPNEKGINLHLPKIKICQFIFALNIFTSRHT